MILPDTSAWIEYLRATESSVHRHLRDLIAAKAQLATNEVIVMEVLAGAGDDVQLQRIRRLLHGLELIPLQGLEDYEAAARLYRDCRRQGETIRNLVDCLIAVTAMSEDVPVLHRDRDFDALARHSALKVAVVPGDEPKPLGTESASRDVPDAQPSWPKPAVHNL